jgi:hypothetical protein
MLKDTPIIPYDVEGIPVCVKREDLCCDGPAFSKMRGVESHISKRPEKIIGVLDTFHSKAGWAVSIICKQLHKKAIVFYPKYKGETDFRYYQAMSLGEGADIVPLTAGRSCILYHQAKEILYHNYTIKNSYMMPNALKLQESIDETAKQVWTVPKQFFADTTWIISISSATIATGVIQGLLQCNAHVKVYLHEGYSRPKNAVMQYIQKSILSQSLIGTESIDLPIEIIDEGYNYKDAIKFNCPFPCNPYYDRKAWAWLVNNLQNIKIGKILFWNIGS